ncbi:hypothetical protein AB0758_44605 [Tolypothrix bouteillei VB521301_2]|uniref:hypothetical protein n=1 Tax=Tolypothrix bouteillei TaxID=1246981 RepID=UPI0038B4591C
MAGLQKPGLNHSNIAGNNAGKKLEYVEKWKVKPKTDETSMRLLLRRIKTTTIEAVVFKKLWR